MPQDETNTFYGITWEVNSDWLWNTASWCLVEKKKKKKRNQRTGWRPFCFCEKLRVNLRRKVLKSEIYLIYEEQGELLKGIKNILPSFKRSHF